MILAITILYSYVALLLKFVTNLFFPFPPLFYPKCILVCLFLQVFCRSDPPFLVTVYIHRLHQHNLHNHITTQMDLSMGRRCFLGNDSKLYTTNLKCNNTGKGLLTSKFVDGIFERALLARNIYITFERLLDGSTFSKQFP